MSHVTFNIMSHVTFANAVWIWSDILQFWMLMTGQQMQTVCGGNLWHPHISGLSLSLVALSITWLSLLKNMIFIFSMQ